MPKVSRVGKFRQATRAASAVAAAAPSSTTTSPGPPLTATVEDSSTSLSRGQKKRMAKREQYLRKERLLMGSLMLKKQQEQAKRIDGLDAIKQALLATTQGDDDQHDKKASTPNMLKSQKSRETLLQKESNQLQLVMQHPAFQADPLATIREHLTNSLADQAAQRQVEQAAHEKQVREAIKTAPKKPKRKKHRARPTRSKA